VSSFLGYHSEWNLGSPGGWDYQRMTQEIAKVVWHQINTVRSPPVSTWTSTTRCSIPS
jgi:hypothetical protein